MTDKTPQEPSLDLDGKLYALDAIDDEGNKLIQLVQEANELMRIKELEFKHLQISRSTALGSLRARLVDVPFTEKEVEVEAEPEAE